MKMLFHLLAVHPFGKKGNSLRTALYLIHRGVGIGGHLERGQMGLESLCKRLNRVYRKVLKYNNLVLMNSFRGNK